MMDTSFLFLIKLAWDLKYRLPCLIAISFLMLDIRMQLDIQVHVRRVEMPPRLRGGEYTNEIEEEEE